MTIKSNHIFHIVDIRPWPLLGAARLLTIILGLVQWFHTSRIKLLLIALRIILIIVLQWWRDVMRESRYQGLHTSTVANGLRIGIILFIISEVMFFFSFFWAFFHSRLAPIIELGLLWPPIGIIPFNPIQIPLLNTIILLSSGVTVTWAHHSIIAKNFTETSQALLITITLGIYFTSLQALEYWEASFRLSDSIYGTRFFIATGFHGLHVIVGTSFLIVCLYRHLVAHFSSSHHFGFEAAAWYWHFVDIVWLFLYISIYWWGY
jgi:cytochrome c oxidase subunit 3